MAASLLVVVIIGLAVAMAVVVQQVTKNLEKRMGHAGLGLSGGFVKEKHLKVPRAQNLSKELVAGAQEATDVVLVTGVALDLAIAVIQRLSPVRLIHPLTNAKKWAQEISIGAITTNGAQVLYFVVVCL